MNKHIINFMPGPVNLHPEVKEVYYRTFMSHRSETFYAEVKDFKKELCAFVNAPDCALFVGSGSLGNEVVAQYLRQLPGRGLILVNGEFGKRLAEQASHLEMNFDVHEEMLGNAFNYDEIENKLKKYSWMWMVHCETSSGVLNDLIRLKAFCKKNEIKLAADCISSIGNIPVDLSDLFLASGTSGKGLSSYPGIAMVYFSPEINKMVTKSIPKYMNLKHHVENNYVPYTINTNLLYALVQAFRGIKNPSHRENIKHISDYIQGELTKIGFSLLGNYKHMMPGIISIVCPPEINSYHLGVELEQNGFYVNFGGAYLRKSNYFQVCIMGHQEMGNARKLVEFLKARKITVQEKLKIQ